MNARDANLGLEVDQRGCEPLICREPARHRRFPGWAHWVLLIAGIAVCLFTLGTSAAPQGGAFELWILQPMITGNLLILLLAASLPIPPCRTSCSSPQDSPFWIHAGAWVLANTLLCLGKEGQKGTSLLDEPIPATFLVVVPTVIGVLVSALVCARRIQGLWMRLLLMTALVLLSSQIQIRCQLPPAPREDFRFVLFNSCLVGLAVIAAVLAWGSESPETPRTA